MHHSISLQANNVYFSVNLIWEVQLQEMWTFDCTCTMSFEGFFQSYLSQFPSRSMLRDYKKVFRCVVQPTSFFFFHCSCKSLRRVVQFEGCGTDVALGFTRVAYFLTSTPRISPGSGIWEKSYTFRSAISPSLSVSKVLLRRDFSGPGWLVKKQSHVEAVYESSYGPWRDLITVYTLSFLHEILNLG